MRNVFTRSLGDRHVSLADFVDSACLPHVPGCLLLPAATIGQFFECLSSHTLWSYLETLSTANNRWTSGTANSNMSAPSNFAAGMTYYNKNGNAVVPQTCASAANPLPRCRPKPLKTGISTCRKATAFLRLLAYNWMFEALSNSKTRRLIPTETKNCFSMCMSFKLMWILRKKLLSSCLNCRLQKVQ